MGCFLDLLTAVLLSVIFGGVDSFWVCGVLRGRSVGRSVTVRRPDRRFWWGGGKVGCVSENFAGDFFSFKWVYMADKLLYYIKSKGDMV